MGDRETTTVDRDRTGTRSSVDVPVESVDRAPADEADSGGLRSRTRSRLGSLFSVRQFLIAAVATLAGLFVVGSVLPLGTVGDLGGIAVGSFVHGALASERRYAEAVLAGGTVAGAATVLDFLVWTLMGLGLPVVGLGVLGGAVAGGVGHYFGRDLRDGLTREL